MLPLAKWQVEASGYSKVLLKSRWLGAIDNNLRRAHHRNDLWLRAGPRIEVIQASIFASVEYAAPTDDHRHYSYKFVIRAAIFSVYSSSILSPFRMWASSKIELKLKHVGYSSIVFLLQGTITVMQETVQVITSNLKFRTSEKLETHACIYVLKTVKCVDSLIPQQKQRPISHASYNSNIARCRFPTHTIHSAPTVNWPLEIDQRKQF